MQKTELLSKATLVSCEPSSKCGVVPPLCVFLHAEISSLLARLWPTTLTFILSCRVPPKIQLECITPLLYITTGHLFFNVWLFGMFGCILLFEKIWLSGLAARAKQQHFSIRDADTVDNTFQVIILQRWVCLNMSAHWNRFTFLWPLINERTPTFTQFTQK